MKNTKDMEPKTLQCPLRNHWVSFRLVDEYGDGRCYGGIPYILHDSQAQSYSGKLDSEGFAIIEQIYCGPSVLDISMLSDGSHEPWHEKIMFRNAFKIPLTNIQVAAEQSPSGPRNTSGKTYLAEQRAIHESARFYRVEVSDFVEAKAHLPNADGDWGPRPSALLKHNAGAAAGQMGVALAPNQHHILEVKALRAYNPLLSRDKAFCAVNAYHLAVMSTFAYAPFSKLTDPYEALPPPYEITGSIGNVLREQLAQLFKSTQFNSAHYNLLYEEVPYSKRLEIVPYDPQRYEAETPNGWSTPESVHFLYDKATETQAFITHNDQVMLISLRGTQERPDILRDLDARQVPYSEGVGQAHRGFYKAFQAAKKLVEPYMEAFYTGEQTLIVCGHSLGGAIALLLAEWLRRLPSHPDVQLYSFGAPRAADRAFVQAAQELVHHRLVNHNDPVPGVPFAWLDSNWWLTGAGTVVLFSVPWIGITMVLGGLLNLQGDPYEHHGQQRHFMPRKPNGGSESSILWQPECALLDEQACARYAGAIDLEDDMPSRASLIEQAFSAAEHSSDSGYARAMLTTLLRWNASVQERSGELFSSEEIREIQALIQTAQEQLGSWRPRSYAEFRQAIRHRQDRRLQGKSEVELRRMYDEGITVARKLGQEQLQALERAQKRLLNEAQRPLTLGDVFGDLSDKPQLQALVAEWRALDENQAAEKLAKIPQPAQPRYA